ncbi:MAG: hypothetical protein ACR2OU_10850 [Thermomicrobiales bacterium]
MVAMAQLIPEDPDEQASVLEVLRQHPELKGFIAKASAKAEEVFPGATMRLDTVSYDEWDPPVRLLIRAPMSLASVESATRGYITWLREALAYPEDLIFVFPQWGGDQKVGQ